MDLYLLDAILKGHLSSVKSVLDLGCGEGRNGVYFIREGYDYLGIDKDASTLRLIEYLSDSFPSSKATFAENTIQEVNLDRKFDLIVCSRTLHFANDKADFYSMWAAIVNHVNPDGLVYLSMDSNVDNALAVALANDLYQFPDGKIRFPLTLDIYQEIKKEFEEVEPLKTVVQAGTRAQSFLLLKKS